MRRSVEAFLQRKAAYNSSLQRRAWNAQSLSLLVALRWLIFTSFAYINLGNALGGKHDFHIITGDAHVGKFLLLVEII